MNEPTVLHKIAGAVEQRLTQRKRDRSFKDLKKQTESARQPQDFRQRLIEGSPSIIAEVKRKSPSKGALAENADPVQVAESYLEAGATALSVLTEQDYFDGRLQFLSDIRERFPEAYLLMKDFVVDEYQLYEARAFGADAVLLIVALLGAQKTEQYLQLADELGLTALVEVHTGQEMEIAIRSGAQLIGVNNRDLKTLEVSLDVSRELVKEAAEGRVFVSESGIDHPEQIKELHKLGYSAFLIGTSLMATGAPGSALKGLIGNLK